MQQIKHDLEAERLAVWIDQTGIEPGTPDWQHAIETAIDAAGCLLVIFSPDAKQSRWVRAEMSYAEAQRRKLFYVLARGYETTAAPFGYTNVQWVDLRDPAKNAERIAQLVAALCKHLGIESRTQRAEREREEIKRFAEEQTQREVDALRQKMARDERDKQYETLKERLARGDHLQLIDIAWDKFRQQYPRHDPDRFADRLAAAWQRERERISAEQDAHRLKIEQERAPADAARRERERRVMQMVIWATLVVLIFTISLVIAALSLSQMGDKDNTPSGVTPTTHASATPTFAPTAIPADPANLSGTLAPARNEDWTPISATFDGLPYVYVPGGCFSMGTNGGETDEYPAHDVCLDAFWIGQTEVTGGQWGTEGDTRRPRSGVTGFEARDFCASRGGRLPTEAEWEYAARGPQGWVYPWGDEFVANNVVFGGNAGGASLPVGSRPGGASWVGAQDMSGNVWEWVSSLYQSYPYSVADGREAFDDFENMRVIRGGAYDNDVDAARAANRYWNLPADAAANTGFRCARDTDE
jgi:hypothetical protein